MNEFGLNGSITTTVTLFSCYNTHFICSRSEFVCCNTYFVCCALILQTFFDFVWINLILCAAIWFCVCNTWKILHVPCGPSYLYVKMIKFLAKSSQRLRKALQFNSASWIKCGVWIRILMRRFSWVYRNRRILLILWLGLRFIQSTLNEKM